MRARHRAALIGGIAAATLVALPATAGAAPTLTGVTVTAPATIDLTTTSALEAQVAVTAADDVYGYELVLAYDPDLLALTENGVTVPDGGFDDIATGAGTVTVTHTRLGASPGLSGDVTLASVPFTALAAGDAPISVTSLTLVGADGVLLAPQDIPATTVVVVGPATPAPTTAPPTTAPPTTDAPEPTGSASAAPAPGGTLPRTGGTVLPFVLVALAATAVGGVLVWRRGAGAR
ncbi:MAG: cohesin domain-containing protein [Cellulomonadaceae bacterium]